MTHYVEKAHGLQAYGYEHDGKHYCVDVKARVRWRLAVDPRTANQKYPLFVLGPRDGVVLLSDGPLITKLYVDR